MIELELRRQFFAEEIEAVAKLKTPALTAAFAAVARERFLPAGPWTVLGEVDLGGSLAKTRSTPDADPARVYHNVAVAIDPDRQLFNGQPSALGSWIDALELRSGSRVLHVGCGLGYYAAVMAHCVGPSGRVVAFEADETLAAEARANLASLPWVEVRVSASADPAGERFDAILVNAGVTHPLPAWLEALGPNGRMMLPLTVTMGPGGQIGKGAAVLVTRGEDRSFSARIHGIVVIYSAVGLRDETLAPAFGKAMMWGPIRWTLVSRLRTDPHEPAASCWYHGDAFCFSTNA
jgi:protein-L-isoaspartate(D-aspartate) O-methyltransferase